jgi:hypothetical protein
MKTIIDFIVEQELDSIDNYPELVKPIAEKFDLDFGIAEGIIYTVIEWETDINTVHSLEEILVRKFPSVVTN